MLKRNPKYFDERKVRELVNFAFYSVPDTAVREISHDLRDTYELYASAAKGVHDLAKHSTWLALLCLSFGLRLTRAVHEETKQYEYSRVAKQKKEDIRLRMMEVERDENPITLTVLKRKIYGAIKSALDRAPAEFLNTFDAIMPSLIVLGWSAFETMCEDLLGEAIKLRPRWLSALNGRSKTRKMPPWEGATRRGTIKTISGGSKGPKRIEDLNFSSIQGIRDAYWVAFFRDAKNIDRVLRSRQLDTLYAFRNIVVHKGGRVDGIFLNRVKGLPEFSHAKIDHNLQMDFGMVKNLVQPVLLHGIKLIVAVSKWISEHPDEQAPQTPGSI